MKKEGNKGGKERGFITTSKMGEGGDTLHQSSWDI